MSERIRLVGGPMDDGVVEIGALEPGAARMVGIPAMLPEGVVNVIYRRVDGFADEDGNAVFLCAMGGCNGRA